MGVFGHSMWITPHDFPCGVAPVGQFRMEGISTFYTGTGSLMKLTLFKTIEVFSK